MENKSNDEEIWRALDLTKMKDKIVSLKDGLGEFLDLGIDCWCNKEFESGKVSNSVKVDMRRRSDTSQIPCEWFICHPIPL